MARNVLGRTYSKLEQSQAPSNTYTTRQIVLIELFARLHPQLHLGQAWVQRAEPMAVVEVLSALEPGRGNLDGKPSPTPD